MNVTRRDWLFAAVVAVVLGVLLLNTGSEKARRVPVDDKHRPVREQLTAGTGREEVERECVACHNARSTSLPEKHPPKEQCLICHPMKPE
jgi:cytochrome c5